MSPCAPADRRVGCAVAATPGPAAFADAWTNVSGTQRFAPPRVTAASMAYDPVDNYLVLFGGCGAAACPATAQTWKYSAGAWIDLTNGSAQPPARADASMAFDSRDGYVVLFGGYAGGGKVLGDTWGFVGGLWVNLTRPGPAPAPRWGAGLSYDRSDSYLALFGGTNRTGLFNDTWTFVGGTWTNITQVGANPAARYDAGFAWDDADSYALLVEGCGRVVCPLNDTWQFLHGKWTLIVPTGGVFPPPRTAPAVSYSGASGVVYLYGGNGTKGPLSDTWRFSAAHWTNATATVGSPPTARAHAAVPESTVAWVSTGFKRITYLLIYSGGPTACLGCPTNPPADTWVLEPPVAVTPSAVPSLVEVGQPVLFGAAGNGGSTPYDYLWSFGDGSSTFAQAPIHSYRSMGSYDANVTILDSAGVTSRATVVITVVSGPRVGLSIAPMTTDVGFPVQFTGSGFGGVGAYAYRWSFGDQATASTASAVHGYLAPATYAVNLTVTDSLLGYGVRWSNVTINPLPTARLVASSLRPVAGVPVAFTAVAAGGTGPLSYNWSFGDGSWNRSTATTHPFASVAMFSVTLTVTDAVGARAITNATLDVVPPQPGFPIQGSSAPTPWYVSAPFLVIVAVILAGLLGGGIGVLLYRRRRAVPPPIAAAAAGQGPWFGSEGDSAGRTGDTRSQRRSRFRFGGR